MKYKAIITDIDGTLVPNRPDGMPSQKVIEAVGKATEKIKVGIATARSYWQIAHILDILPFNSPCIITGGAQVINPATRKTFIEHNITIENIFQIAEVAETLHISLTIANREGEYVFKKNSIPQKPLDIYTNPISLALADEFIQKISHISTISSHKAVAWSADHKICVTVSNPKASKHEALLEVAKILGIRTEEIIGIGEGYNDFPFLMACGLKVAMGNAVGDVKAIADYIAPTVEEDGVADVIEKFVL